MKDVVNRSVDVECAASADLKSPDSVDQYAIRQQRTVGRYHSTRPEKYVQLN
jgi:hypothetical protein